MTKYTAADFANARFAEHEDGRLAVRDTGSRTFPWRTNGDGFVSDGKMPDFGWVPVPTKPTIAEGQVNKELKGETKDFEAGFHYALAVLEAEIIPDPEPTNTERLVDGIAEAIHESGRFSVDFKEVKFIAKYLDKHGVKVEGK